MNLLIKKNKRDIAANMKRIEATGLSPEWQINPDTRVVMHYVVSSSATVHT